ncbi:hypothetical protein [Nocardia sp. NPDC052316]|uniref:hypothetical protein n=1 Tax=Nocardia sp. NPDC052316 TaxID=3364329 RepID=UPI0037C5B7B0
MGSELAEELRRLENEKRTGVLFAGDGAFHLAEGAVTAADCLRTSGLARLVSEAGVATAEEWLAAICRIAPHVLVQECVRRGDPVGTPWPARLVDRAPVVPVRRGSRRVVLTAGQAEVLAAANTRRSVTGLGEYLGRTTYGCLVAVVPAEAMVNPLRADAVPPRRRRARPSGPVADQDRWEPVDPDLLVRLRAVDETTCLAVGAAIRDWPGSTAYSLRIEVDEPDSATGEDSPDAWGGAVSSVRRRSAGR